MAAEQAQLQKCSNNRRCTIPHVSVFMEDNKTFPFVEKNKLKAWNSMDDLNSACRKCSKDGDRFNWQQNISVNVGGQVFKIPKECAVKYPNTRIGSLVLCSDRTQVLAWCDDYSVQKNEFFFDRDPSFFHHICHFYTSGVLWVIREMCPINFEEEIAYWGLNLKDTQRCCCMMFEEKVDEVKDYLKVERELMAEVEVKCYNESFKDMIFGNVRKTLWNTVEYPYFSTVAKAFNILSSLLVLFSITAMTLSTVEDLQMYTVHGKTYMDWTEIITIVFFTFEYFARLISTPKLRVFLMSGLNFVDLLAVVPYFFQLIFELLTTEEDGSRKDDSGAMACVNNIQQALKVFKFLRVFRIFKLARHSTGMRAFGFTLRQCYQQVSCIFLFIVLGIFMFAALLHSAERETEGSSISSIPYAWWWAAVRMTNEVAFRIYVNRCVEILFSIGLLLGFILTVVHCGLCRETALKLKSINHSLHHQCLQVFANQI